MNELTNQIVLVLVGSAASAFFSTVATMKLLGWRLKELERQVEFLEPLVHKTITRVAVLEARRHS